MNKPLSTLKGIGPARLKSLQAAGLNTLDDLVLFLPREYRDLSSPLPIAALKAGVPCAVRVRVSSDVRQTRVKKLVITKIMVTDGEDVMPVVWYNQPWLKQQLTPERELLLYGKPEWKKGVLQMASPTIEQGSGLIPVYPQVTGIPGKALRQMIAAALDEFDNSFSETLPQTLRLRYGLCEKNFALRNAHTPLNAEALSAARRRLAFEELLLYQVRLSMSRNADRKGVRLEIPENEIEELAKALPFPLTNAQKRVLTEITEDLRSDRAMARMVQGDVGCGKTAVALLCMAACCRLGYQSALMAPTEVLARQHYDSAMQLLAPMGLRIGLLTGSLTQKQHRLAHEAIASGEWDIIIGTHALITEGVNYARLGLVITDEQHRFGVRQRSMLGQKGADDMPPNVLVMSATPIPRTLSLILYGDMDLSVIDELPPGRTPVTTRIVPEAKREGLYGYLREEVHKGRQVYVVCPLVEESEAVDALPAEQVYEDLRTEHLPDLRIALVHGRMKAADKDAVLEAFHKGESDVLVSTTVIEVGVNVPNATIMVIENAERFGLAQLHQLRGRVGRGNHQSWCFLMADPNERLRFLCSTNDGFRVAQKDLDLRGPGELYGTRQSGAPAIGLSLMDSDANLLKETHDLARTLVNNIETEEAQAIIRLTEEKYGKDAVDIGIN